jgi:hypothetical protein
MKKLFLITVTIAIGIAVCIFCSFHIDNAGFRKTVFQRRSVITDTTEDLPRSYKQRRFLNDVLGVSTDLLLIPGNIVVFHPKDTSYEFRTVHSIIRGNRMPVSTAVGYDGVLYSGLITANTSFNGSYLIGNLRAEKDEILDIVIKDEVISTVPDSLVDVETVKSAIKGISAEDLHNYFYVKAATLTSIENRKYSLAKFDNTKNAFYLTSNGKTYISQGKAKIEKVVSMFLVPLDRLNHQ